MKQLTSSQAAQILLCSVPTVHKIPPGQLPYTMVGSHRRYNEADVRRYLGQQVHVGEASERVRFEEERIKQQEEDERRQENHDRLRVVLPPKAGKDRNEQ